MTRYVKAAFWRLSSGKLCKYCCSCTKKCFFFLAPAVTSYFFSLTFIFLVNCQSDRYSPLGILYRLPMRNLAVQISGSIFEAPCIWICNWALYNANILLKILVYAIKANGTYNTPPVSLCTSKSSVCLSVNISANYQKFFIEINYQLSFYIWW